MASRFRMPPATLGQSLELPLGRRANPVSPFWRPGTAGAWPPGQ